MANVIGDAFIEVKPKTDGFDQQVKKDVEGPVQQANRTAQQSARNIARALVGAFAVRQIFQWADAARQAFFVAESSSLRLQATFEMQRKLQDTTTDSVDKLAEATLQKTRFDDDATRSAAAQLAQFRLTEGEILTLLPLVQDFAAFTGRDLGSAADASAKAILGQGRALKALGIDFVDLGSRTANFDQLVRGLQKSVGGFAEREGASAAGQAEIFANQLGEVNEELGKMVNEFAAPVLGFLEGVGKGFLGLPGPMQDVIGGALILGGGLVALNLGLKVTQSSLAAVGIEANIASTGVMRMSAGAAGAAAALIIGIPLLADWANNLMGIQTPAEAADEAIANLDQRIKDHAVTTGEAFEQLRKLREIAVALGGENEGFFDAKIGGPLLDALETAPDRLGLTAARAAEADAMMDGFAGALHVATDELISAADATRELLHAQNELAGGFLGIQSAENTAKDAHRALEAAQARLNRLVDNGKQGTDRYTEAKKAARDAEVDSLDAQLNLVGAIESYASELDKSNVKQADMLVFLEEQGRKAGLSKEAIDRLKDSVREHIRGLDDLPGIKQTRFEAPGLDKVKRDAQDLKTIVDGLQGATLAPVIAPSGPGIGGSGGGTGGGSGGNRPRGSNDTPRVAVHVNGRQIQEEDARHRILLGGT